MRKEYYLLAILAYLILWQLEEIRFENLSKIVSSYSASKMIDFVGFLFDMNLVKLHLQTIWFGLLDEEYVKEYVIEPIVRNMKNAEDLKKQLENRIAFGAVSAKKAKHCTVSKPFLLTVPRIRRVPSPKLAIPTTTKTTSVPKSLYTKPKEQTALELKSITSKAKALARLCRYNRFKAAVPPLISKKEVLKAKLEEEQELLRNVKLSRPVPQLTDNNENNVKLTVASILREDALLKKKGKQQMIAMEQIEMGLPDIKDLESLKQAIRTTENNERVLEMSRKRLEVQLSHEEAILAKKELLKENKERAELILRENQELKKHSDLLKKELAVENKKKKAQVDAIQANVVKAREKLTESKIRNALAVQTEKRELQDKIKKQQEDELQRKATIIQQIRLLQSLPVESQYKPFNFTESSGLGILGEMSIAEVCSTIKCLASKNAEIIEANKGKGS